MSETVNSQGFVHLRVRSAYSLLEGAIKAGKLGKMAAEAGMPAVAITDRSNLFGALEFSVYSKDNGVQPIIGCALPVKGIGAKPSERWSREPTITLLVQNERGYLNLSELSSLAYLESGELAEPVVPWAKVVEYSEGLILLSGGTDGPVDSLFAAGKTSEGVAALACALDLMVGPMTATSNLAAACGVETWVLAGNPPWPMLGTGGWPWYARVRAFAPEGPDDWTPRLEALGRALEEAIGQAPDLG